MSVYFIPPLDSPFNEWQGQFARAVAANAASLGLTAEELAALAEGSAAWSQDYAAHIAAREAAQAACTTKDGTRADFTVTIQRIARQIQANPHVDDGLKLALGLPAAKQRRRRVPPPGVVPMLSVMPVHRFQHQVDIRQPVNRRRAKPAGVSGCELWVAYASTSLSTGTSVGLSTGASTGLSKGTSTELSAGSNSLTARVAEAQADHADSSAPGGRFGLSEEDFRFLKVYTRAPALVEHTEARVGQTAVYMARWVNRRGEPGPWSPSASATVAG